MIAAKKGLGAVLDSSNCWTVPDYCDYLPFGSFFSSCQMPTATQLNSPLCNAGKTLNIDANAAVPPASQIACDSDPSACANYNATAASPILTQIVGGGSAGQIATAVTGGNLPDAPTPPGTDCTTWTAFLNPACQGQQIPAWLLALGIGVGAVVVLKMVRG